MKFYKMDVKTDLYPYDTAKLTELLKLCWDYSNSLDKITKAFNPTKQEALYSEHVEELPYYQLSLLEEFFQLRYFESLELFAKVGASQELFNNRRARDSVRLLGELRTSAENYVLSYVPLLESEIEEVYTLAREALGNLSCFLIYQYGLNDVVDQYRNSEEYNLDASVHQLAGNLQSKLGNDLETTVGFIAITAYNFYLLNKPKLTIFEDHPELEDDFYNMAGPYIQDFEKVEDNLTIDIVKKIINGEVFVEDVIKELEGLED